MHLRKLYATLFVFILFVIIFFVKQFFTGVLYQDEHHYLPTAVLFSSEPFPSLHLLRSYNELNTPLPFILGGWVVHLFGGNIQYLRLLTAAVSLLLLLVFIWSSPDKSGRFWLCLIGLMAFPNYYLCSVFYYTDIFAMFFTLAAVVAYVYSRHFWGFLFFVGAVCCRQYMLAFPAAIVAFEIFKIYRDATDIKSFTQGLFSSRAWIFYFLAVLSIVPWVLLWQGPAPAAVMAQQYYDSNQLINYNPGFVLYASVCLAVYYVIPETLLTGRVSYFIDFPRQHPRLFVSLVIFVLLLISFFPARQAFNPYFTWPYLGYVDQFLMTIGISGMIKQACFGVLMLITLMRFVSPAFNLTSWMVIINTLLLGKAQLSWDKYSLPLIMLLWFLAMFEPYQMPSVQPNSKKIKTF